MAQTGPILLTLLSIVACFIVFGLFSVKSAVWKLKKKDATFWGAGIFHSSPAQVSEKYPLNIYPAPWAISIIWPVTLFWNVAAIVYLLYRRWSKPLFQVPLEVFILWTIAWFLTTVWTFLFDGEVHLITAICVLMVTVCSFRSFYLVAKLYEKHWKILAKESTTGRDIMSPDESATIGAIIILCYFLLWFILDITYWIERSDCVRTLYPSFSIIMLFLGLSNSRRSGMSLNNILCYALCLASTVAFLVRKKAKTFFAQRRYNSPAMCANHDD